MLSTHNNQATPSTEQTPEAGDLKTTLTVQDREKVINEITETLSECLDNSSSNQNSNTNRLKIITMAKTYEKSVFDMITIITKKDYFEKIANKLCEIKQKSIIKTKLKALGVDFNTSGIATLKNETITVEKMKDILRCASSGYVKGLNLINCIINEDVATRIASFLIPNKTLTEFCLEECTISADGIENIATALASNTSLGGLSLNKSNIDDRAAIAIANALVSNKTLKSFRWKTFLKHESICNRMCQLHKTIYRLVLVITFLCHFDILQLHLRRHQYIP